MYVTCIFDMLSALSLHMHGYFDIWMFMYTTVYTSPNVFHNNVLCVGAAHLAFINAYRGSSVPLVQRRVEGAVVDATEAEDEVGRRW